MRPRAFSHGTKVRDLSRRVKENQLRIQDSKNKMRNSSSRDSIGAHKQSELSIIRSHSQEYNKGSNLTLPEDEYMTVNAPPTAVLLGASDSHSTPISDSHFKSKKHAIVSPDTKLYIEQNSLSARRSSFRKDRHQGSSSESLSSSGSDKCFKNARHLARQQKTSVAAALQNKAASMANCSDTSEYMDASPLTVSELMTSQDDDDSYFMYEPGQQHERSVKTAFAGLEKVISPIRDDLLVSPFQIVSPIKEEDNDALFGPKPKTLDKETLERLKELKHEYVNIEFEEKQRRCDATASDGDVSACSSITTDESRHNATSVDAPATSSDSTKDSAADSSSSSLGFHSKEHDYMEIDLSSSDNGKISVSCDNSKLSAASTGDKSESKGLKAVVTHKDSSTINRNHEYCEIDFGVVIESGKQRNDEVSMIPDPFGELSPVLPMNDTSGGGVTAAPSLKQTHKAITARRNSSSQLLEARKTDERLKTATSPVTKLSPPIFQQAAHSSHSYDLTTRFQRVAIFDVGEPVSPVTTNVSNDVSSIDVFNLGALPTKVTAAACEQPSLKDDVDCGKTSALRSSSSTSSFSDSNKCSSQSSLTRSSINNLHSCSSSGALDAMSKSVNKPSCSTADLVESARCRHSYHENSANEAIIGARQASKSSLNSTSNAAAAAASSSLNYARLDLSSSCADEPCLQALTVDVQFPGAAAAQRSPSLVTSEHTAPVSYAQIDFDKCEQLKQAEATEELVS